MFLIRRNRIYKTDRQEFEGRKNLQTFQFKSVSYNEVIEKKHCKNSNTVNPQISDSPEISALSNKQPYFRQKFKTSASTRISPPPSLWKCADRTCDCNPKQVINSYKHCMLTITTDSSETMMKHNQPCAKATSGEGVILYTSIDPQIPKAGSF